MIWISVKREYCLRQHPVHSESCRNSSADLMSPYWMLGLSFLSYLGAHSVLWPDYKVSPSWETGTHILGMYCSFAKYLSLSMQELKAMLLYFLFYIFTLFIHLFLCECECVYLLKHNSVGVEVRRQLVGVISSPLLCGSQGLNSGHQCLCPLIHHTRLKYFLKKFQLCLGWGRGAALKTCSLVMRAFVATAEDPGSISNTYMVVHNHLSLQF